MPTSFSALIPTNRQFSCIQKPSTADKQRPVIQSGITALDSILPYGGLPQGRLCEFSGHRSSGRYTLALTFCLHALCSKKQVAWIDTNNTFYPLPALELGFPLEQLLVIRLNSGQRNANHRNTNPWLQAADILLQASGALDLIVIDLSQTRQRPTTTTAQLSRLNLASERSGTAVLFLTDPPFPMRTVGEKQRLPFAGQSLGPFICLQLIITRKKRQEIAVAIAKSKFGYSAQHAEIPINVAHSMHVDTTV